MLYSPSKVYPNIWDILHVFTSKLYQHNVDLAINCTFCLVIKTALNSGKNKIKILKVLDLSFNMILYMNVFAQERVNQRTSGPVNFHLTPGPGILFNAFIHVYSPRAGADNPLGTNVDVN